MLLICGFAVDFNFFTANPQMFAVRNRFANPQTKTLSPQLRICGLADQFAEVPSTAQYTFTQSNSIKLQLVFTTNNITVQYLLYLLRWKRFIMIVRFKQYGRKFSRSTLGVQSKALKCTLCLFNKPYVSKATCREQQIYVENKQNNTLVRSRFYAQCGSGHGSNFLIGS